MKYTKEQKIKDLETLKSILSENHIKNLDPDVLFFDTLFICHIVDDFHSDKFNIEFSEFIKKQIGLIDTKFKDLKPKTKAIPANKSVKSLLKREEGVWHWNELEPRVEFIDRVIETLNNQNHATQKKNNNTN